MTPQSQPRPRRRRRRRHGGGNGNGGGNRPFPQQFNPDGTPIESQDAEDQDPSQQAAPALDAEGNPTPVPQQPQGQGRPQGSYYNAPPHSLEQRCVRQFPRIALSRGREYFKSGRVADPVWTEKTCTLAITGAGGTYQVTFDFTKVTEERKLPAKCDCPAYVRGVLCKHLWAALLQIDKTTPADAPQETGPLKLVHEQPRQHREPGVPTPVQPSVRPAIPAPRGIGSSWVDRLNQLQGMSASTATKVISARSSASYIIAASDTSASGKLVIDLWTRSRTMNGELGPMRPNRVGTHDFSQFDDMRDREVLQLLTRTCNPQVFAPYGRTSGHQASRFTIDPIFESHIVPMLASGGRLYLSRSPNGSPDSAERPLRMDRGDAWELELRVEAEDAEHYRLDGGLKRDGELCNLSKPIAVLRNGFLVFADRIGRFAEPRHAPWAIALRGPSQIIVPRSEGDALLTRILLDSASPRVTWPADMGWSLSVIEPRPKGVFRPLANDPTTGRMTLTVSFDYAGREVALSETEMTLVDVAQKRVYTRNQEFEERTLLRALEIMRDPQGTGSVPLSDLHRAANDLCLEGWNIYIENQKLRIADDFAMNVTSSTDWFDLKLEATFGGNTTVNRADLLAALESKSGLVKLSDGSLGMLPQDWIAKYASITQFGEVTDEGSFRFTKSQGLMLNAAIKDDKHFKADSGFISFRERIQQFEGMQDAIAPTGFQGQLRNYQKDGLAWLRFLEAFETGGILADDMGLGKTIQILAYLLGRSKETKLPNLVVTPKSLAFNWIDEASKFVPDLKVVRYSGAGRAQKMKELQEADLVVTTYGTLRTDIDKLEAIEFDNAIIDEAQAIKNPKSQAAIACKRIRARHRLALTGTPVENSINDLLSILEYTNPGLLNLSRNKDVAQDTQAALAKMLRPFLLRRTKEKVLTELPDKSEQVLFCEMSTEEKQFYNAIRDHYRASLAEKIEKGGLGKSKMHVLEALLRLRQAACHAGLIDPEKKGEASAKLQLLLNHIQEVTQEGHKVLVFSQFTSLLALVKTMLDDEKLTYEYLDGQTEDRKAPVERFQNDPKCQIFLISLKAGGTGLNLTAADYVFILDPWWNPAVEAQAIGRAHRMGQTQKVFAYRMIAKGTVEEKILELQKTKKELAESLISEDGDMLKKLSKEDLEMLLT